MVVLGVPDLINYHPRTLPLSRSGKEPSSLVNLRASVTHLHAFNVFETTATSSGKPVCECYDMHKDLVPYDEAWCWQKSLVQKKRTLLERNEECPDVLIILQHLPVYTLGTGSSEEYIKFDTHKSCIDVYRTDRGGEVTYHGPGQLVMYPILNLRNHMMDLHWYLRALEEVVIRTFSSVFSISASRVDGFTGVWVGDVKVAAIGIRAQRWIAYHGLALNVTPDLKPFEQIVPCGIRNRKVGSVRKLLGEFGHLSGIGGSPDSELIDIACESLIHEFSEVFQLQIEKKSAFEFEV